MNHDKGRYEEGEGRFDNFKVKNKAKGQWEIQK